MVEAKAHREHRRKFGETGSTAMALRARLKEAGYDTDGCKLRRCYHSANQRSAGAWSWFCEGASGMDVCGSQMSMTECLKLSSDEFAEWVDGGEGLF